MRQMSASGQRQISPLGSRCGAKDLAAVTLCDRPGDPHAARHFVRELASPDLAQSILIPKGCHYVRIEQADRHISEENTSCDNLGR